MVQNVYNCLISLPKSVKFLIAVLLDVCLCVFTTWLAISIRYDSLVQVDSLLIIPAALSCFFAVIAFSLTGFYRVMFRYSGWSTITASAKAMMIYTAIYSSCIVFVGVSGVPRSVGILQPLLLFVFVVLSRMVGMKALALLSSTNLDRAETINVLIFGAGTAGRQLASALTTDFRMNVVGFLDDDQHLHGRKIQNIPVSSLTKLPALVQNRRIRKVLLAAPSLSRARRNQVLDYVSKYSLEIRTLPTMTELASANRSDLKVQDLDIDDLLGRDIVEPDPLLLSAKILNKTVLVTGAGGSIGQELVRQILTIGPTKLVLFEVSEVALYSIFNELDLAGKLSGQTEVIPLLGSVTDYDHLLSILNAWRPDIIFHAAAYKHVPLVEHNVIAGVRNNVFGTYNVAKAALSCSVADCLVVSSDKAVRPTNVMGASKRLAEMIVQALQDTSACSTRFSMVRFGNVLASSGSVIPQFKKQITGGGPVTVTHSDVTRYFMTISEAAQLVIQASALAKGGDIFLLDMGDPVKILDLAKRMIRLSGFREKTDENTEDRIEIKLVGLRPGEKLFEELLIAGEPEQTKHSKIMRATENFVEWESLSPNLDLLLEACKKNRIRAVHDLVSELVCDYENTNRLVDYMYQERKISLS